jgi:peptide-methionine (S)-S-oxide reductase
MHAQRYIFVVAVLLAVGYVWLRGGFVSAGGSVQANAGRAPSDTAATATPRPPVSATAIFAAGCFWCAEADFEKLPGVIAVTSGYTGGRVANPTYKQVSGGGTGHTEAVQVVYDPSVVSYEQLLDHFWHNVDPFMGHGQFCDFGDQYRPEIFVHNDAQRRAAEASKSRVEQRLRRQVVVAITAAGPFYRAEDYHQDYYKKNSLQYRYYRWGCGRDARLKEIWDSSRN